MLIRVRRYRYCTDYSGAALSTFLRFLEVRHAKHKFNGGMAAETGPRTGSAKQPVTAGSRVHTGRRSGPDGCAARRWSRRIHTYRRHLPPQDTTRFSDLGTRVMRSATTHVTAPGHRYDHRDQSRQTPRFTCSSTRTRHPHPDLAWRPTVAAVAAALIGCTAAASCALNAPAYAFPRQLDHTSSATAGTQASESRLATLASHWCGGASGVGRLYR